MSKPAFDKIKAGLDSAKAHLEGTTDKRKCRVHVPKSIDMQKIRTRLGKMQERMPKQPQSRKSDHRTPDGDAFTAT
jgi:hypothetical protein